MPRNNLFGCIVSLAVLLSLAGCGSTGTSVVVTSQEVTNGGRPFYAVVRSVEQATHLTDTYESIAAKVFANPADPSVLAAQVIYPGVEATVEVQPSETLPLGVYFLFTEPGERWKVLQPKPLPSSMQIDLGVSDVVSNE